MSATSDSVAGLRTNHSLDLTMKACRQSEIYNSTFFFSSTHVERDHWVK